MATRKLLDRIRVVPVAFRNMTATLQSRVAGNIRAELARKGYTHEQVGKHFGLSRQAISNKLDGTTRLSLDDVEKFAAAIGCDVDLLLTQH